MPNTDEADQRNGNHLLLRYACNPHLYIIHNYVCGMNCFNSNVKGHSYMYIRYTAYKCRGQRQYPGLLPLFIYYIHFAIGGLPRTYHKIKSE